MTIRLVGDTAIFPEAQEEWHRQRVVGEMARHPAHSGKVICETRSVLSLCMPHRALGQHHGWREPRANPVAGQDRPICLTVPRHDPGFQRDCSVQCERGDYTSVGNPMKYVKFSEGNKKQGTSRSPRVCRIRRMVPYSQLVNSIQGSAWLHLKTTSMPVAIILLIQALQPFGLTEC